MGANRFDLHLHSYFSDGRLSPEDLIKECKKQGLEIVALTDHEHVGGIPLAMAEGKRIGVKVIPGIEISTDFEGAEHHILGLGIDWQSPTLQDFLAPWAETKKAQIIAMIEAMRKGGFLLSLNDVMLQGKGALNRAHIAYAVLARREENKDTLEKFGLKGLKDLSSDIFKLCLEEGSFGYRDRKRPGVKEAIRLIKLLNGIAIWAHPLWKTKDIAVIKDRAAYFQELGLDGLEVGYSIDYQGRAETAALHEVAQKLSMLETAGSDFHSFTMPSLNKVGNFEILDSEFNLPKEVSQCFT